MLVRGMIRLFVTDVITTAAHRLQRFAATHQYTTRDRYRVCSGELGPTTVELSPDLERPFQELKAFIYQFIINHWQVNRQDWRARKVLSALFRAFWLNPLTLPSYVLLRAGDELGFPYLRDMPMSAVAAEVSNRYHSSPGFARLVVDHIAGMSDRFALEEYHSLEQPETGQRFLGRDR